MNNKYALLIGNAEYNDPKLNLKTPIDDVLALEQVLLDGSIGAFDEVNVLTNATSTEMRHAIGQLFTRKHAPDDMLLFYFSGHGELDDESNLYLVARDTERGPALSYTGLDSNFIANLMTRARSRRQVIILDSCYSGAFGTGAKGSRVGTKNIFEGNGYGRYVLTASDALQLSWEGNRIVEGEITNSFFTHYLLDGLRTGAADRNGDGLVDLNELYDHIYDGMMTASSKQEPLKFTFNEKGDLAIARSPLNANDRRRQQLTRMLLHAETALGKNDYYRAEMLLNKVIHEDPNGISGAAAQSLLKEVIHERTRAEAYTQVKMFIKQAPRTAKTTWDIFVKAYPNYDPDGLYQYFVDTPAPPKPTKPRNEQILPPPFEWIKIPAGRGTMKTDESTTLEIPTQTYWISKYTVTNAQFAKFIEAGGYKTQKWWTEAGWAQREKDGWTEPRYWQDEKWNGADYPVVGVSWYEAIAFCQWLSDATGKNILLPTEAQWQYAAQGDDNRTYPWGNNWDCKRCHNSVKPCDQNQTAPVTAYSGRDAGDSPFGVVQMSGNVWEWCLTQYQSGSDSMNGTDVRILRGGSWDYSDADGFRCEDRGWGYPDFRGGDAGFRLALS